MELLEGKRCAVVMLGNLDQSAGDLAAMAAGAGTPQGVPLIACSPQRLVTKVTEDGDPVVQQPYSHDRLWQKWSTAELVPLTTLSVRKAGSQRKEKEEEGPGESSQGQGENEEEGPGESSQGQGERTEEEEMETRTDQEEAKTDA